MNADEVAALLASSPIFAELDQAAIRQVAQAANTRRVVCRPHAGG